MIDEAREFSNDDDKPAYVWIPVDGPQKSIEVSRIFEHWRGGLTLRSCIAYH